VTHSQSNPLKIYLVAVVKRVEDLQLHLQCQHFLADPCVIESSMESGSSTLLVRAESNLCRPLAKCLAFSSNSAIFSANISLAPK
jgi:hypothetical protein